MNCPKCGKPTQVTETRKNDIGMRRRRSCSSIACNHRITTQEVIVHEGPGRPERMLYEARVLIIPKGAADELLDALLLVTDKLSRQQHHEPNETHEAPPQAVGPDDQREEAGRGAPVGAEIPEEP